ncbi:MAG: glycosyltransferase family 4 protein [Deltaproteobacteria bacterium]|nr:glycosyltransferase family 4 protein [Deltaproteobacteria bacterium]
MVVGFDLTWMNIENRHGGVFQYALRLVSALVKHTDVHVVSIISRSGQGVFESLKVNENFREVFLEPSCSLLDIIKVYKINVVHTPVQSFQNLTFAVPMISTLHDLQPFHLPEFFSKEEIELRNFYYRLSAEFAERVIVSFHHVKEDIIKFYGIPSEKIDVCPLGAIDVNPVKVEKFSSICKKYGIPEKYLFYSANTWRHKNHLNLIRALKILHEKYGRKISLICTGQKYPDFFPVLEAEIEKLNLQDFVKFTGYIPEEDVRLLLKNTELAIIPTLYEAGSFPLMEAMAYEVPVICSNVTSLPETIGDTRFLFDPNDAEQIAEKAALLIKDEKLREANKKNSKERRLGNTWEKTVNYFLDSYIKAIEEFKNVDVKKMKNSMEKFELLSNKLNQQNKEYNNALLNSMSWKITAPLRTFSTFFGTKFKKP